MIFKILVSIFLFQSVYATSDSKKVEEISELRFGKDTNEGIAIIRITSSDKPAYLISYFIGSSTLKSRVLVRAYFDDFKKQLSDLEIQFKNQKITELVGCKELLVFSSRINNSNEIDRRYCIDHTVSKTSASVSSWILTKRRFINGQATE